MANVEWELKRTPRGAWRNIYHPIKTDSFTNFRRTVPKEGNSGHCTVRVRMNMTVLVPVEKARRQIGLRGSFQREDVLIFDEASNAKI